MHTVEELPQVVSDAVSSSLNHLNDEIVDDDPSLYDASCTTPTPAESIDATRTFRQSLFGLPFEQRSTPPVSSSNASLLFYQLYALSILDRQPNTTDQSTINTCATTNTTLRTNFSYVTQPSVIHSTTLSKSNNSKSSSNRYGHRCICILIVALLASLAAMLLTILSTAYGIRLLPCYCPTGYELNATSCTCTDRNECFSGGGSPSLHTCTGVNMQCINTMGSFTCRCRPGFIQSSNTNDDCVDIDECDLYKPCNTNASICINLPGRYYCQCLTTEINNNNDECIPKNICAEQNDLCGPHSECVVSSSNGYNCQCLPGHVMFANGQCSKVNECALIPSVCEHGRSCILTRDRFDCCTSNLTRIDTGECVECGLPVNRRQARIVNGDRSHRGQWPWMAVVGVYFRDDTNHWINITQKCAATLIGNRYLLTAAHCLSSQLPTFDTMHLPNRYQSSLKDTYRVSFDVIDVQHDIIDDNDHDREKHSRTFDLEHVCIHPDFNHNTLLHDIAILKLKQPIIRNSLIDTICLPSYQDTIRNGTRVWVAGWGSNAEYSSSLNVLMHADLQILPPSLCQSIESVDYQMCAGWSDGKKDACRGDSGGPLMIFENNRWSIIGIVSFGDGCSRANSGGIYTRVSAYEKWISQIMSSTSTTSMNCSSAYDYTQIVTDTSLK